MKKFIIFSTLSPAIIRFRANLRGKEKTPVGNYCAKGSSLNFLFERKKVKKNGRAYS